MDDTSVVTMRPGQWSPGSKVNGLTALMGALALVLFVPLIGVGPVVPERHLLGFLAIGGLFAASEVMVVHLEARSQAYSLSFSEVPLVLGLALASPFELVAGRLVGAGLTLWLYRRQSPMKILFNLANFALETVVALLAYRLIVGNQTPVELRGWLAGVVSVLVANPIGVLCVTAAIWIYSGRPTPEALRRALVTGEIFGFVNAVLGVGVVASLWRDPLFALPLLAGALLLYLLYRAYIRLSQRYDSLETLHGFTEEVSGSLDLDVVSGRVLASARALLRCEQADLLLLDPGGDHAVLYSDADGNVTSAAVADEHARNSVDVALPTGKARLVDVKQGVPVWLSDAPLKDLIAAPIMFDQTTVGLMTVVNRLTPVSTFGPEDVRLLETLANQAGVALENSRLFGRLQDEAALRTHQALHDGLTGLPNRQLLMERLIAALGDARRDGHKVAVLYLDLEGFKDINDTLGHQAGDVVLRHVCDRIGHNLPHGATLARFGGDEFVVLLPRCYDQDQAIRVGGSILESLVSPFTMQDLNVAVGAGIGIALFPDHATDPTTLLQRADVAMYSAKAVHGGLEVYAAERDPFTPQRLALAGELRQAIGRREIEVYYQPKVSATTGVVLGAEALVRWRHPNHGLLMPDQFIPAAERSSVIHLLTQHVLGTALESCRLWRASGLDLSVSVNLSMRDLLDPRLPGDVLDLLVHYGVPAEALVLELTESSAMTEARRTMGILSQLKEMGVKVSIDDFGTGYSSLTYLRRLPISELKVDRQFVMNLTFDKQDAAIVQTTVELGKRLNLTVVAEGVENQETADELARYGCDLLQGFFVSRPLPARTFDAWLQRRPTRPLTV